MRVAVEKAIPVVSAIFNFVSTRHEEIVMYDDVLPRGRWLCSLVYNWSFCILLC